MADEDEDGTAAEGGGGASTMMLGGIGLVAFLLGGGAGFAAKMFLLPCQECEAVAEVTEDGEVVAERNVRAVHPLNTFTVNLRGTGGGRVLRMEVQLEVDGGDLGMVEDQTPVLRDAVLMLASDYTYADLEGIDGKARFRDELMSRLNGALTNPMIKRVYFTQFVVQ
jgi:flagellar basal body-associated protein FliL